MQQIILTNFLEKNKIKENLYENEKNFTYIFETYYKRVYNYIYYRVNCHHDAEDLTSQVFEKVMLKIDTYSKDKSPFEVWLFAIARNTINDYFRTSKKYKFLSIDRIKELVSKKETPENLIIKDSSKLNDYTCFDGMPGTLVTSVVS